MTPIPPTETIGRRSSYGGLASSHSSLHLAAAIETAGLIVALDVDLRPGASSHGARSTGVGNVARSRRAGGCARTATGGVRASWAEKRAEPACPRGVTPRSKDRRDLPRERTSGLNHPDAGSRPQGPVCFPQSNETLAVLWGADPGNVAAKCRYCGEWLDPSRRPEAAAAAPVTSASAAFASLAPLARPRRALSLGDFGQLSQPASTPGLSHMFEDSSRGARQRAAARQPGGRQRVLDPTLRGGSRRCPSSRARARPPSPSPSAAPTSALPRCRVPAQPRAARQRSRPRRATGALAGAGRAAPLAAAAAARSRSPPRRSPPRRANRRRRFRPGPADEFMQAFLGAAEPVSDSGGDDDLFATPAPPPPPPWPLIGAVAAVVVALALYAMRATRCSAERPTPVRSPKPPRRRCRPMPRPPRSSAEPPPETKLVEAPKAPAPSSRAHRRRVHRGGSRRPRKPTRTASSSPPRPLLGETAAAKRPTTPRSPAADGPGPARAGHRCSEARTTADKCVAVDPQPRRLLAHPRGAAPGRQGRRRRGGRLRDVPEAGPDRPLRPRRQLPAGPPAPQLRLRLAEGMVPSDMLAGACRFGHVRQVMPCRQLRAGVPHLGAARGRGRPSATRQLAGGTPCRRDPRARTRPRPSVPLAGGEQRLGVGDRRRSPSTRTAERPLVSSAHAERRARPRGSTAASPATGRPGPLELRPARADPHPLEPSDRPRRARPARPTARRPGAPRARPWPGRPRARPRTGRRHGRRSRAPRRSDRQPRRCRRGRPARRRQVHAAGRRARRSPAPA